MITWSVRWPELKNELFSTQKANAGGYANLVMDMP